MTFQPSFSTQDLAKLLNINVSTVKRWADNGQLPCIKTPGGHRRFRLEDVYTFLESQGICPRSLAPVMESMVSEEAYDLTEEAILNRQWPWLQQHLISTALKGDMREAVRLFVAASLVGIHPSELCDHLISPAMHHVGEQWATNRFNVADEHLITHTITSALSEMPIHWGREQPPSYHALCGCLSPDQHELACQCIAQVLSFEGWQVAMLGAATPVESFVSAIERHRPDLVCLSSTVIYDPVAFKTDCERIAHAVHALGKKLLIGGSAIASLNHSCANEAAAMLKDMGSMVEYVRAAFPSRNHPSFIPGHGRNDGQPADFQ